METLKGLADPVDLVLLDGWKDLYLPVLEMIKPSLRPGSIILADNIFTFRKAFRRDHRGIADTGPVVVQNGQDLLKANVIA